MISPNQSGFVEKRQMIDNIFIVQEAIDSSKERKERVMEIKLDKENTFDKVRHSFLFAVLDSVLELIFWPKFPHASMHLEFLP
jgi:hypothetical protein